MTVIVPDRIKPFLPFIASTLLTAFLLAYADCQYETNDDMTMIRLLSGRNGLAATPDAVFLSLPLGAFLYKLYQIAGGIPWYGLFLYTSLVAGCSVGAKIILSSNSSITNKISCSIVFLGFYAYLVCQLNFAGVSLFLWLSTVAAVTLAIINNTASNRTYLFYGCLLAASFLIRPDILKVSLFFSTPLFASIFINFPKRKLAILVTPFLAALLITTASNSIFRATPQNIEYAEFNKSRSDLLDLYTGESTGKTIESIAASGWNIPDYFMASKGWIHDSNIYNSKTFSNFTRRDKNSFANIFSPSDSIKSLTVYKYHITAIAVCFLLIASSLTFTSDRWQYKTYLFFGSVLFIAGLAMLMTFIRFPPRVALPVFSYMILLAVTSCSFFKEKQLQSKAIQPLFQACCVIAVIASTVSNIKTDFMNRKLATPLKNFTDFTIKQIMTNVPPDTILVNTNTQAFSFFCEATNPLSEYGKTVQFTDFPGGWLIASPAYNVFLQKHGFIDRNSVVEQMLADQRVVFHYWQSPADNFELFATNFIAHLQERYSSRSLGKTFRMEIIFDNRGVKGNFGWVFFKIRAA